MSQCTIFQISAFLNNYKCIKNTHVLHDLTCGAVEDTEGRRFLTEVQDGNQWVIYTTDFIDIYINTTVEGWKSEN